MHQDEKTYIDYFYLKIKKEKMLQQQTKVNKRPGDWICPICHNLNFSFREKCNRCHLQNRDAIQTQLFQQGIYMVGNQTESIVSKSERKMTESDTEKSEDDTQSQQSNPSSNGFTQALFVENLVMGNKFHSDEFIFEKTCGQCRKENYFYESRCRQCFSKV